MEAQATTGGTDSSGGANRGRGFDFNVFASELFNSITVRKTAAAETEEGSLGATIDLQATRPFDYDGFTARRLRPGRLQRPVGNRPTRAARCCSPTPGTTACSAPWSRSPIPSATCGKRASVPCAGLRPPRRAATNSGGFCSPVGLTPQNPANSAANGTTATNCAIGVARPANTAQNIAAYNTGQPGGRLHPAPAALRPPDPPPGAPGRHRRLPVQARRSDDR